MGHGFGSICIVALAIVVSPAGEVNTAQAQSPAESRVIVGVVRGDGILLPLASRQNEEWTTLRSFDSADRGTFRLVDTSRIPREGWIYVPWNVGGPRPLVIRDPVTIDAHCNRQEGFRTDAPPPSVKLDAAHLMAGIALHGDASAVRVEDVARQPDATSRRAAQFVVQLTTALEAERAAVAPKSARTTIPADGRDRVAVEITTLARDRVREAEHYYFETRKRYGTVESVRERMAGVVTLLHFRGERHGRYRRRRRDRTAAWPGARRPADGPRQRVGHGDARLRRQQLRSCGDAAFPTDVERTRWRLLKDGNLNA